MRKTRLFIQHKAYIACGLMVIVCCASFPSSISAEVAYPTNIFTSSPINLSGDTVSPHVMINTSNDHQFYFKAYNDYSDLDGDGDIEKTYEHSVDYYGYFDSNTCYEYKQPAFDVNGNGTVNADDNLFAPFSKTTDKYCTGTAAGKWSGNFLNWVTMSRIDTIRKILFGGFRRLDTSTNTVLERTYLPHDAHSWAKHYNGSDLNKLTPFVLTTDYVNTAADLRTVGITFANTTDVASQTMYSQQIPDQRVGTTWRKPDPPLMKVIKGNYSLWASNERWQCTWSASSPVGDNHGADNGNVPAVSGVNAYASSPSYASGLGLKEYVVRIQACVPGLENTDYCKKYPGGNLKPVGLFQKWGDGDDELRKPLLFGMMAGTYSNHAEGGELVSDIRSMRDEVNVDTDGTFKLTVDTIGGPQSTTGSIPLSIISQLSLYRIYGYKQADGTYYDGSSTLDDDCTWGLSATSVTTAYKKCTNWGNPFSEIYLQSLRYMAGLGRDGSFNTDDRNYIVGISQTSTWQNPLYECNTCARLNILNFNASSSSYDHDSVDDASSSPQTIFYDQTEGAGIILPGVTSNHSIKMTDVVGKAENIHGNKFFIGQTDVSNVTDIDYQICTDKTINSFGMAMGICPEAPRLNGSFTLAGLAYYAHVYDIRPGESDDAVDCGTPPGTTQGKRNLSGEQKVDTYSVTMATAVPVIEIKDPATGEKAVTLMPACRNSSLNPKGNCAIVDFKVISQNVAAGTGKFYVNWEDSEQGGDYDQDMWGTIEYVIDAGSIKITTDTIADSTPNKMGFGYVISGTLNNDGFHAHSGIRGYTAVEANVTSGSDCSASAGCVIADTPSTATYTRGTSSAGLLKDPLWYAAKWGGFIDRDGNKLPFNDNNNNGISDAGEETFDEWDRIINATGEDAIDSNNDGVIERDGIPDNYFFATNPADLEDAIDRVFATILERSSSGTAAAVVANNIRGEGALYQAYYEPLKTDTLDNKVTWIGSLSSMWIDSSGYMREEGSKAGCVDLNGDGDKECNGGSNNGSLCTSTAQCPGPNYILDDYETDPVIETFFDSSENKTRVRRWTSKTPDTFEADTSLTIELAEINAIWNARTSLSKISDSLISDQRSWSDIAGPKRYIKTWIDSNLDGIVDSGEYVDFDTANTALTAKFGFFDLANSTDASNLINYVRGKEITTFRNRTVDYDGDGVTEVMRLGDIVNSTPTVVAAPQEAFHLLYSDLSYAPFVTKYANRRNVVYVGANDGMLHAFNAGFYVADKIYFSTYKPKPKREWVDPSIAEYYASGDTLYATPHPLGSELWAYVPMNLLPHLKWLKDPYYSHVSFVDGKPRVFDAKIFTEEGACTDKASAACVHPNGWGTVMVVGMGMGGSPMTIDSNADGLKTPNATDNRKRSSAYVIFDITNPEIEPTLLAEIQVPDGSYSMVYPAVMAMKDKVVTSDQNKWYLVFGNGPDDLENVDSSVAAELYVFDLAEIKTPGVTTFTTSAKNDCTLTNLPQGAATSTMKVLKCDTGIVNSFVGNPTVVDWDLNYKADVLYYGLVGWREEKVGSDTLKYVDGRLMRLGFDEKDSPSDWVGPMTVIDTRQPISAAISLGVDNLANRWLFFGTGRFLSSADRDTSDPTNMTSIQTQSIYGVKDRYNPADTSSDEESETDVIRYNASGDTVYDDLIDATNIEVYKDFSVLGAPTSTAGTSITTFQSLVSEVDKYKDGWFIDLPPISGTAGVAPATRAISQPALFGGILFTSVYQPSTDPCSGEGYSRLYGLYYKTGTAYPGVFKNLSDLADDEAAPAFVELGRGFSTSPSIHSGTDTGSDKVNIFTQLSTGEIFRQEAGTEEDIRSGKTSWRDR